MLLYQRTDAADDVRSLSHRPAMASPGRRAPFREFALSVGIDFSGALKVA